MTISALVITLDDDEGARTMALAHLEGDARITVGEMYGVRLPVVLETESLLEGEALATALMDTPGIAFVDVVSVDFSSEE
jgi:hypothetical protein